MINRVSTLSICAIILAGGLVAKAQEVAERKIEKKPASVKVDLSSYTSGSLKASSSPQPKLFYVSKNNNCSTFDLANGGVMNFVMSDKAEVYPLVYVGTIGKRYVYWESSPYGWYWVFAENGAIYFHIPSDPVPLYEFDGKANKLARKP